MESAPVPDDTGPALPRRTKTPYTDTAAHRPPSPEPTGSGPVPRDRPDPETLRRVADALRKLSAPEQQARAAARIRAGRPRS
jgi:hypothetical protein